MLRGTLSFIPKAMGKTLPVKFRKSTHRKRFDAQSASFSLNAFAHNINHAHHG
jgi:hypothetical protein